MNSLGCYLKIIHAHTHSHIQTRLTSCPFRIRIGEKNWHDLTAKSILLCTASYLMLLYIYNNNNNNSFTSICRSNAVYNYLCARRDKPDNACKYLKNKISSENESGRSNVVWCDSTRIYVIIVLYGDFTRTNGICRKKNTN